tara:strand:- start:219 stop:638 length:420 start_codon:yes stop_codon:yes gene_type:complete
MSTVLNNLFSISRQIGIIVEGTPTQYTKNLVTATTPPDIGAVPVSGKRSTNVPEASATRDPSFGGVGVGPSERFRDSGPTNTGSEAAKEGFKSLAETLFKDGGVFGNGSGAFSSDSGFNFKNPPTLAALNKGGFIQKKT